MVRCTRWEVARESTRVVEVPRGGGFRMQSECFKDCSDTCPEGQCQDIDGALEGLPLFREHMLRLDRKGAVAIASTFQLDDNFFVALRHAVRQRRHHHRRLFRRRRGSRRGRTATGRTCPHGVVARDCLQCRKHCVRRPGVGSILFTKLIEKARVARLRKPAHHDGFAGTTPCARSPTSLARG